MPWPQVSPPPADVSYAIFNQGWSDAIKKQASKERMVLERVTDWLKKGDLDQQHAALWLCRPWLELHSGRKDKNRMADALWYACLKIEKSGQTAQLFGFIQELLRLPQTREQQQWLRRHLQDRWCTEVVLIDLWLGGRRPEQWLLGDRLLNDQPDYREKHWYYWLIAPILVGSDPRWLEELLKDPLSKGINIETRSEWEREQKEWCARAVRNLVALPNALHAAAGGGGGGGGGAARS